MRHKLFLLLMLISIVGIGFGFFHFLSYHQSLSPGIRRGINLGNALEAPQENDWGVTLKPEYFSAVSQAGFDFIRVPINWQAHSSISSPYLIDQNFFHRIDEVIEDAQKNNLTIILDMHNYELIMADSAAEHDRFLAIWGQISQHYQTAPPTVYFEILNEPHGKLCESNSWNNLVSQTLSVIRKTNPDRKVIIDPCDWGKLTGLSSLEVPSDKNLVVSFHYYEPYQFTHQGAPWVENSKSWLNTIWTGNDQEIAAIKKNLDAVKQWGIDHDVPILMGEFGAINQADASSRQKWTFILRQAAQDRGMAWAYWEMGADFGIYDMKQNSWDTEILSKLIPSK